METPPQSLSPLEYATYWITAVIGNVLFVWPGHVVSAAGENALGSVLAVIAGLVGSGLLHHYAIRRELAHRPPGWLLTGTAGISLLLVGLVDGALLALLCQMLHTLFYADTPQWALLLPFLGILIWGGGMALDALGRLTQLWVPVGGVVLAATAAIGLIHATHLRPLWPQNWYVAPMVRGAGIMAYLVLPVGPTVILLAPRVNAPARSQRRAALAAAGTTAVTLLAIYALVTMMLGPQAISRLRWPLVYSLETITLDSTFFISRVGLAVIFLWTAVVVLAFAVHLRLTTQWLTPKKMAPPIWLVGGLAGLYGLGLIAFRTPSTATRWVLHTVDPIALVYLLLEHGLLAIWLVIGAIAQVHRRRAKKAAPVQN